MNNKLKLGIFTTIGLFATAISIFAVGTSSLGKTYNIYVIFDDSSSLHQKASVKIAGVDVGFLKKRSLEGSKAKLKLSIDSNVPLYKNASASIVTMGVVGTRYIKILPGDQSCTLLKDGDYISALEDTSDIVDIANKISRALDSVKDSNIARDFDCVLHLIKSFLENTDDDIARTVKNLSKFCDDLVRSLSPGGDIQDALSAIKDAASKFSTLPARICDGNGLAAYLINDKQPKENLKEAVASLKALEATINKYSKLKLSFDPVVRYNIKDKKLKFGFGGSVQNEHNFLHLGVSDIPESGHVDDNDEKNNTIKIKPELLLGGRFGKFELYGGIIRGTLGVGGGYSFFQPIYTSDETLKINLNVYDFTRKTHGPKIDADIRFHLAKWFYLGTIIKDITKFNYKTAFTPYLTLKFKF
ncbi:hypothetical protein AGMMS50222_04490 [Endomicrobiia bacterium]|nr:hypothetical protein AGMMS49556_03680 [Endomicrobiia bacterium]GHT74777.1 hypothetical protein AGMMS50222_04490 [Endomicrobiia bacterium]